MAAELVTIDLGQRSYDIYIGDGGLFRIADYIPVDVAKTDMFLITDDNVKPYAQHIEMVLKKEGASKVETLVLPHGEATKSYANLEKIHSWLLDNGVQRGSLILAVGGGVIGDLAGFAASTIMRGVDFVQVPTTLLSQVDSSVGGKTGINMKQGKNLVGTFYQPIAVVADTQTLRTLPRRELLAGYAEVVKYGLIEDSAFFEWLEENGEKICNLDKDALSYAIKKSCEDKAAMVRVDEKEKGRRALLNLGHTFGHALETAAGYNGRLLHGEAVAIGMVIAFEVSARMGLCSREDVERVERHLKRVGLPVHASYIEPRLKTNVDYLLSVMGRDKKVSGGRITFVLVKGIGEAFITQDVPESLVRDVLKDSLGSEVSKWKSAFSFHS